MSLSKINTQIDIISTAPAKDSEGFVSAIDKILASVRAYKEERQSNEKWTNMAAFSTATALFRFRKIPVLTIDNTLFISCESGRYRIINVEDVRGMYVVVLVEKQEGTVR